jgi:hypothetical protein
MLPARWRRTSRIGSVANSLTIGNYTGERRSRLPPTTSFTFNFEIVVDGPITSFQPSIGDFSYFTLGVTS